MKRLIDKICAIWCILISKEYVIYTCDEFGNPKSAKCWVSIGVVQDTTNTDRKIFLDTVKDYTQVLIDKK